MNATSLQNLHDIIVPEPVAWLPPAPGWYVLGIGLLLTFGWFSIQRYLMWQRNRYRREALAELKEIGKKLEDPSSYRQLLPQIPQLVKRTAIAGYTRDAVASLSGDEWLAFLDKTGSTHSFSGKSRCILIDCSYQTATHRAQFSNEQIAELQKAVFYWIKNHKTLSTDT